MPETAEELSRQPDVRKELVRATGQKRTWIDAIVRYLVSPREAGSVKTRLIPKLLAALNAEPRRVMFPKGDAR